VAVQDTLIQAQQNIANLIVQVTVNPQPSYTVDGESYSWTEYLAMLISQQKALAEAIQVVGGPFEFRSRGRT
jgi:hypothetical protein